jgi:hypothetical protein
MDVDEDTPPADDDQATVGQKSALSQKRVVFETPSAHIKQGEIV